MRRQLPEPLVRQEAGRLSGWVALRTAPPPHLPSPTRHMVEALMKAAGLTCLTCLCSYWWAGWWVEVEERPHGIPGEVPSQAGCLGCAGAFFMCRSMWTTLRTTHFADGMLNVCPWWMSAPRWPPRHRLGQNTTECSLTMIVKHGMPFASSWPGLNCEPATSSVLVTNWGALLLSPPDPQGDTPTWECGVGGQDPWVPEAPPSCGPSCCLSVLSGHSCEMPAGIEAGGELGNQWRAGHVASFWTWEVVGKQCSSRKACWLGVYRKERWETYRQGDGRRTGLQGDGSSAVGCRIPWDALIRLRVWPSACGHKRYGYILLRCEEAKLRMISSGKKDVPSSSDWEQCQVWPWLQT